MFLDYHVSSYVNREQCVLRYIAEYFLIVLKESIDNYVVSKHYVFDFKIRHCRKCTLMLRHLG